ncbi:MAG TPA: DUF2125 domain-containing protein, partial [Bradyrhizobium sp.]
MRRTGLAVLILVASLLAIDAAIWQWASMRLGQEVERWSADAQTQGWTVRAGSQVRTGWPFAAAVVLPGFSLTADPAVFPAGLIWGGDRIRIQLALTAPKTLHVLAEGRQTLQLAGVPAIPFEAGTMDLEAALDGGVPPELSIAALQAELAWGPLTIGSAVLRFTNDTALLDAQDVAVPGGIGRALGSAITPLHVRGVLNRPILRGPSPASQARAWRAAGG